MMRQNKMLLKGFEQHFILLSFLTIATALTVMIGLVMGVLYLIDPLLLGDASLKDCLYVGALAFALVATTYYYSMRIDHRVSGPIYVLMRNLDRLGEGDLTTEMRLRHQDHLQEITGAFNRNSSRLCQQIESVKQQFSALDSLIEHDHAARDLFEKTVNALEQIKTRS